MAFILFAVSAIILTLEILQTKLFSYSLEPGMVFVVIAVALLGLGVSATLLSLRPRMRTVEGLRVLPPPDRIVRFSLLAMAACIVLSHWVFSVYSADLVFKIGLENGLWKTPATLTALALPYFFGGLVVTAILSDSTRRISRLYALNLVGSAIGCAVIFFALRPLGAPVLLAVLAAATALLAILPCRTRAARVAVLIYAVAIGSWSIYGKDMLFDFKVQPHGHLDDLQRAARNPANKVKGELSRAYQVWDPMGCIEVSDYVPEDPKALTGVLDSKWFTQDSSYGSPLVGVGADGRAADPFFFQTVYGAAYFRGQRDTDVLVIGLGGAPDVQAALRNGARKVVGVDINRSTIEMVRSGVDRVTGEPFAKFLGHPYDDPGRLAERVERGLPAPEVEIVRMDGRSFVQRDVGPFDVIQLTGVDTKFVLASGNLAVHENYLYTRQAFTDFIQRLRPQGTLSVVYGGLDYLIRLTRTAQAALEDLRSKGVPGIGEPHRHIVLLRQGWAIVNLIVKRTPFTDEECRALLAWVKKASPLEVDGIPRTGILLLPYEALQLSMNQPVEITYCPAVEVMRDPFVKKLRELRPEEKVAPEVERTRLEDRQREQAFVAALHAGRLADWVARQPLDLEPVVDDRPYFFHRYTAKTTVDNMIHHLSTKLDEKLAKVGLDVDLPGSNLNPKPWMGTDTPFHRQVILIFLMLLIAAVLTFAPLLWFRIRGNKIGGSLRWAIYFAALGLGFIMVEVGLIQRYVLFLGTQSYAFAVVIGGLLIAAGLGSLCSGAFTGAPRRTIGNCVLAIVFVLVLQHFFLAPIFEANAELPLVARLAIGFAALLPLGFPMGFLFPTGLYRVRMRGESFVPWGIGLNGVFSVLGSTLALPLSILLGFTAVTAIAGGTYLVALWMVLMMRD